MKQFSKNLSYWLGVVAVGLMVGTGLQFVQAWTEPGATPPGGNVGAPINTSTTAQTKAGSLGVSGNLMVGGAAPNVANGVSAVGDVCTALAGGKCLSTITGGGGSGGNMNGSGTVNYLSKFTAVNTIGNSQIFDDGSYVGIGTSSPRNRLDVAGNLSVSGSVATQYIIPLSGTLTVNGNIAASGGSVTATYLSSTGSSKIGANLDVGGSISTTYISSPTGTVTIAPSLLDVRGNITVSGSVATQYIIPLSGTLTVNGNIAASGGSVTATYLSSTGSSKIGANLDVGGNLKVGGSGTAVAWYTSSDARLKQDIQPLDDSLQKVLQLRGVSYYWKDPKMPDTQQIGVIAQEVEKVLPQIVSTGSDGYKAVDYSKFAPVLIEAVKEQQKEIESLKAERKSCL